MSVQTSRFTLLISYKPTEKRLVMCDWSVGGDGDILLTGPFTCESEVLEQFAELEKAIAEAKEEALRTIK